MLTFWTILNYHELTQPFALSFSVIGTIPRNERSLSFHFIHKNFDFIHIFHSKSFAFIPNHSLSFRIIRSYSDSFNFVRFLSCSFIFNIFLSIWKWIEMLPKTERDMNWNEWNKKWSFINESYERKWMKMNESEWGWMNGNEICEWNRNYYEWNGTKVNVHSWESFRWLKMIVRTAVLVHDSSR
jgi:hypothetical protein